MIAVLVVDALAGLLMVVLAALLVWDTLRMRRDRPERRAYLARVVARGGRRLEDFYWVVLGKVEAEHAKRLHLERTAPGAQWLPPVTDVAPPKLTVISNDSLRVVQ